jgi:histidyl-tRNA synthetase
MIEDLKRNCRFFGVDANFIPSLARGLAYYNGSVFEVKAKKMRETITAGGSFMFNGIQSTGISFGLDRLAMLTKMPVEEKPIMIISIGEDEKAIRISEKLRNADNKCLVFSGKITKALTYANSKNIEKVIFVGKKELTENKVKVRDMKTGKERLIALDNVIKEMGRRE